MLSEISSTIINKVLPEMKVITGAAKCSKINAFYAEIVHDNICNPVVQGIAELWVVLAAVGFVLLSTFIVFPCVTHMEVELTKPEFDPPAYDYGQQENNYPKFDFAEKNVEKLKKELS